jgi:hypothetical protein
MNERNPDVEQVMTALRYLEGERKWVLDKESCRKWAESVTRRTGLALGCDKGT